MSINHRQKVMDNILNANMKYHANVEYVSLLNKLVLRAAPRNSGIVPILSMEIQEALNECKTIRKYIKEKMIVILGNHYFGEVIGKEVLIDTISVSPIDHISNFDLKQRELLLNELILNPSLSHFMGVRTLRVDLKTGEISYEDKGTIEKIKFTKIPKVTLSN